VHLRIEFWSRVALRRSCVASPDRVDGGRTKCVDRRAEFRASRGCFSSQGQVAPRAAPRVAPMGPQRVPLRVPLRLPLRRPMAARRGRQQAAGSPGFAPQLRCVLPRVSDLGIAIASNRTCTYSVPCTVYPVLPTCTAMSPDRGDARVATLATTITVHQAASTEQ
jgi:hypothetical protein